MTYRIVWNAEQVLVSNGAEAVATLERIAADDRGPFLMHVLDATRTGPDSPSIELVYGHADRAMLMYPGEGGGWAYQPDLPLATTDLGYDYGTVEPARTRLTAAQARRAVAEFVDTGARPNSVSWLDENDLDGPPITADAG